MAILTIYIFQGTGDNGDSINHYLFARYAPNHPELYFNHWAKPLFVLLASPFAQFGFIGIKLFNAIITGFTVYLTAKSALKLKLDNSYLVFILCMFSPLYFILTFSGLTEPLFAFFISLSLFCFTYDKYIYASLLISFLPFIRSEGLILIGVVALFFLHKKDWKALLFLSFGHFFYSIAGWPYTGDLLWVFNKIPYARMSSTYGKGELFHFVSQLFYVLGAPIYILFMIGLAKLTFLSIKKKIKSELFILIFLGTIIFITAHSLFWYLGIFNSMGLKRVLIAIIPLISIIALHGYNVLTEEIKAKQLFKNSISIFTLALIVVFPFTSSPASINLKRDLGLTENQKIMQQISEYVHELKKENNCIFHASPYFSITLNLDHFEPKQRKELTLEYNDFSKTGDILIWDSWFSVVEYGIMEESLNSNKDFFRLKEFKSNKDDKQFRYVVYQRK